MREISKQIHLSKCLNTNTKLANLLRKLHELTHLVLTKTQRSKNDNLHLVHKETEAKRDEVTHPRSKGCLNSKSSALSLWKPLCNSLSLTVLSELLTFLIWLALKLHLYIKEEQIMMVHSICATGSICEELIMCFICLSYFIFTATL